MSYSMRGRPPKNKQLEKKRDQIEQANRYADMLVHQQMTIRQIADKESVSKSTVYNYLKTFVSDPIDRDDVEKTLRLHYSQRHLHGGESTKRKYEEIRKQRDKKE